MAPATHGFAPMGLASALAGLAGVLAALGLAQLVPRRRPGGREGLAAGAIRLAAAAGRGARSRLGMRAPATLADLIAAAGSPRGLGVRELIAAKLAATAAGAAGALPLGAVAPGRLGVPPLVA